MVNAWIALLIAVIGPLLGFGFAWMLQHSSHRQRIEEARLARLRERQAEVLARLFRLLYRTRIAWARSQDLDLVGESDRTAIIKEMFGSEKRLQDYFNERRFWLDESLCGEVEGLFAKLANASQKCMISSVKTPGFSPEEKNEAWQNLRLLVNEDIPAICQHLERKCRKWTGPA